MFVIVVTVTVAVTSAAVRGTRETGIGPRRLWTVGPTRRC
jgi:hypothetical protein